VHKPESDHETDSAVGPIIGEAPEVAGPIFPGGENGATPRHDDWGDDLKKVLNESTSSEPTLRQIVHKIPTLAWCNLPDGSSEVLNQRWQDYVRAMGGWSQWPASDYNRPRLRKSARCALSPTFAAADMRGPLRRSSRLRFRPRARFPFFTSSLRMARKSFMKKLDSVYVPQYI
jgi:hypothetical protein